MPSGSCSRGLLGGVLAFMGAMAYAELAALRPKAGGEYVYLREAYGPLAGFLTGWTSFVAGFSGAIAASAVFFIVTLDRFVPGIANGDALLAIPIPLTVVRDHVLDSHARGERRHRPVRAHSHRRRRTGACRQQRADDAEDRGVRGVHHLRADRRGPGRRRTCTQSVGPVTLTGWMFAMIPVMFTYSGWNAASYMAEEIRDPGRNVPRALILGTAASSSSTCCSTCSTCT